VGVSRGDQAPGDGEARAFELLVALAATVAGAAGGGPEAGPEPDIDGLDWDLVFHHAARTNVLPFVGWWFYRRGNAVGDVPSWCRLAARLSFSGARAKSQQALAAAREVTSAFADAHLPLAFRKGLHVATLYPDLGCRVFDDVDLLVGRDGYARSEEILTDLNFETVALNRHQRAFLRLATHNTAVFVRRCGGSMSDAVWLDLATALSLPALRPQDHEADETADALARGATVDGIAVLDPVDLLVDLVTNLYVCCTTLRYVHDLRFRRLNYYVDPLVVARELTAAQWAELAARVERGGLDAAARFAFGNLYRLFPGARLGAPDGWLAAGPHLDEVGGLELAAPYRWTVPFARRFTLDAVPADVPPSRAPIIDR
jgi:Uncharacterised nucleotidyltransferase